MQCCCKNKLLSLKTQQHCNYYIIKMKQVRNTVAKTAILNLLHKSDLALSHAEIQLALDGLCDRVTIYRVLDRLMEEDLVHKVVNVDGGVRYASCHNCEVVHNHNHLHFSCQKCKSVTCIEDVQPLFKLPKGYKISEVNFTVSGLCPQCS